MTGAPEESVAVASSGGHWIQFMRLRPAWRGCDVAYLTMKESYGRQHTYASRFGQALIDRRLHLPGGWASNGEGAPSPVPEDVASPPSDRSSDRAGA